MTLQRGSAVADWKQKPPENTPRLRLKPKAPTTGYVDGAVLLVIPAQTDPDRAHDAMMAAATRDDASTIDSLLAAGTQ